MVSMTPIDRQICNDVATALASPSNQKKNYLFMEPVDTTHFTTYTAIVKRPMDIGTLRTHLDNGRYQTREEFYRDAALCFQNAETFHKDKPENAWVIKLGKDMLKILNKEKRKAEKKYLGGPSTAVASSSSSSSGTKTPTATKKPVLKLKLSTAKKDKNKAAKATPSSTKTPTTKNPKLKLQLKPPTPSASTTSDTNTSTKNEKKKRKGSPVVPTTPPVSNKKISLKLKKSPSPKETPAPPKATGSTTIGSSSSKSSSKKAQDKSNKPTAHKVSRLTMKTPKLKLKLGKVKASSSNNSSRSSTPTPKEATSTNTKKLEKLEKSEKPEKIVVEPVGPSRGKELPTSVAIEQAKKQEESANNTNKDAASGKKTKKNAKKEKAPPKKGGKGNAGRGKELPKGTSAATTKTTTKTPSKTPSKAAATKAAATKAAATKAAATKAAATKAAAKTTAKAPAKSNAKAAPAKSNAKSAAKTPAKTATKASPKSASTTTSKLRLSLPNRNSIKNTPSNSQTTPKQKSGGNNKTNGVVGTMTPSLKAQCCKVLSALKRRERENSSHFLSPVNDARLIEDYKAKIPVPSDLGTIGNKLEKNQYPTVADFVHDIRRVFSNCLRYNAQAGDEYREVAGEMVAKSENFMYLFIYHSNEANSNKLYPRLLYCWRSCLEILDSMLELKNPDDNLATAYFFSHPVSYFCGGGLPDDYSKFVKTPMDLGSITSKLFEGVYQSVYDFIEDCLLVPKNCKTYHADRDDGAKLCEQASRLEERMKQLLDNLRNYDISHQGKGAQNTYSNQSPIQLLRPPKEFMKYMLEELRNCTYTDKFTKLSEPATRQFEDPVDMQIWKDYSTYVQYPMHLKLVDQKIEMDRYETPESFEYDVNCIFSNCVSYNVPKRNDHIVNVAKYCAKVFRKIYSSRIKAFEASGGSIISPEVKAQKKRPSTIQEKKDEPPAKKAKANNETVGTAKKAGKAAKKTLNVKAQNEGSKAPRSKSPKPRSPKPEPAVANDAPLEVNVAIDRIMKEFPNRRAFKDLQTWESMSARFFRELKRHGWISGSQNRFIFNAPVTLVHPEIKQGYNSKIKNPMDLTTCECKLLQGGFYNDAQDFVNDISLVFTNAVAFNRAGKEDGDPMSCNYFDVSQHLLRYSRWLSLEHLLPFLIDDSGVEGARQTGPLTHWKLTTSNRIDAIAEMENIVMNYELDKSEVGERFTFMEAECEKLLKSLRHQTDVRHMTFFLQPTFPPDYCAYISKPISWQQIHQNLQNRNYNTIKQVVDDLRLIFTNAQKYNEKLRSIDPVSNQAYDSAILMSKKLEVAIVRMLITVSDRIQRDKIDQIILDREIEANERAEEETLKQTWKKERDKSKSSTSTSTVVDQPKVVVETIKIVQKKTAPRRNIYYDEEPTHQRSDVEASRHQVLMQRQQKQRRDRAEMQKASKSLGLLVYASLAERSRAISWAKAQSDAILSKKASLVPDNIADSSQTTGDTTSKASSISATLKEKRVPISLSMRKKSRKKLKRLRLE